MCEQMGDFDGTTCFFVIFLDGYDFYTQLLEVYYITLFTFTLREDVNKHSILSQSKKLGITNLSADWILNIILGLNSVT